MPVTCSICKKIFSNLCNHDRHLKEVHKVVVLKDINWNSRCLESSCDSVFNTNKKLMEHLQNMHSIKFETESFPLENMNDFNNWKSEMELANNCYYILKWRNARTTGEEVIYYKCNRSQNGYNIKETEERQRLLKSQGSCKLKSSCTSEIKIIVSHSKIVVEWQKVHYGHSIQLQHIRVPKLAKQNIVTKLVIGVTPQRILDTTRDQIGEHLKRIDLLTSRDLRNLKNSYGLEVRDGKRDPDDAFSVALWVQECESLTENPVLLYKQQGKEHNILRKDDFCLIIMNTFQRQMIKKFPSTITIDSTHGLNGYDFELTTIMVLDEFHHGFPVAEMFTNRKDTVAQNIFFTVVKEAVGVVCCKFFMSDMAECFFNAWLEEMVVGEPYPEHLFCSWHVDRAWQSNLNKIAVKEKRTEIYKILKTLQQETSQSNFMLALSNALDYMGNDEKTKHFGEYFRNTYSHNFRKWAYCFRTEASINTNMHLESMHKVIKYFYLERKTIKRLDKGLNTVLKYVRDKSIERIIRLSKGEHTHQTRVLSQNHKEALKNSINYTIVGNNSSNWTVSKNDNSYTIRQLLDTKCCEQICLLCKTCRHMFSCECKFYKDRQLMCKHIHIVLARLNNREKFQNIDPTVEEVDISKELLTLPKQPQLLNEKTLTIKAMAAKFESLNFKELDDETISKIHYHLTIATNLTNFPKISAVNNEFEIKNKSSKRLIEPQTRFTSTKKKRVETRTSLKRASVQEAKDIQENLTHTPGDSFVYKSVLPLNDHQYC